MQQNGNVVECNFVFNRIIKLLTTGLLSCGATAPGVTYARSRDSQEPYVRQTLETKHIKPLTHIQCLANFFCRQRWARGWRYNLSLGATSQNIGENVVRLTVSPINFQRPGPHFLLCGFVSSKQLI